LLGDAHTRTQQYVTPKFGVFLAQTKQEMHGDHFLPEDETIAPFPQLPAGEEDEACVVLG
jgi:hypothetical protein